MSLADVPEPSITVPQDKQHELTQSLERVFVEVIRPAGLSDRRYFAAVMEICRICGAADLDDGHLAEVAEAAGVSAQDLRRYVDAKAVEPSDRKAWERARDDLAGMSGLRGAILHLSLLAMLALTAWLGDVRGVRFSRGLSEQGTSHHQANVLGDALRALSDPVLLRVPHQKV